MKAIGERLPIPPRDPRAVALSQRTALDYRLAKHLIDRYGDDAERIAVAMHGANILVAIEHLVDVMARSDTGKAR